MDAFQRRHIDQTGRVPQDHHTVARAAGGDRVIAALGDGLGPPFDHLAALEVAAEQRVQLHPLKQLVHIETGFSVVEPDHEAECDEVGLERIHEAAAERVGRKRPAEGMDDHVERPLGLPDLLHAEREDLGILGAHALAIEPRLRERPPRALSQYRDLRDE